MSAATNAAMLARLAQRRRILQSLWEHRIASTTFSMGSHVSIFLITWGPSVTAGFSLLKQGVKKKKALVEHSSKQKQHDDWHR